MFTGLIEEIGLIKSLQHSGEASKISIEAKKILDDLKIDDSVSVNGVCLTVVEVSSTGFVAEAVEETIKKTTLSDISSGQKVNLERALTLSTRLGGHLVLGHVDTIGNIIEIRKQTLGTLIKLSYPLEFENYVVREGSICIDGVSLTISEVNGTNFMVSIIPHTAENTLISKYSRGTKVNLEFDIIGKYVEKMVTGKSNFEEKLKEFFNS